MVNTNKTITTITEVIANATDIIEPRSLAKESGPVLETLSKVLRARSPEQGPRARSPEQDP